MLSLLYYLFAYYLHSQLRTYDTKQPFGCDGIAHILRLEVFATKGGANIEVFREIVAAGRIRAPTIALLLTVVCCFTFFFFC